MDVKNDSAFAPGNLPVNVKTISPVNYNPDAPNAPVKVHATGFRNMLGLVFHANGKLYGATNQNSTNDGRTPKCDGLDPIGTKPHEMSINLESLSR